MSKLRLTLACWDYDRTRALADGRVRPEGIDLNFLPLHVEETFFRMLRNREFDVAEMSLSSYCVSLTREDPAFVAIPVFPSRFFRHSCIFVSSKSGISRPEQLAGKKVDGRSDLYSLGVMLFQMLAGVLPFRGESMAELMYKIASEEAIDVRAIRKELPTTLANIVALSLSKRPETRYQNGDQLAADLRQVLAALCAPGDARQAMEVQAVHAPGGPGDFNNTQMHPPTGSFNPVSRVTSPDIEI